MPAQAHGRVRWTGIFAGPPLPSKHPYRPLAARLEAAADLHRVASTAMRLLRGYYEGYYEATTRSTKGLLRGYYGATTRLLGGLPRGYYKATTRLLRGYHHRSRTCTYCALGPFYFIGHPYILFITLITRSCTSILFAYSPHGSLLDRTPSTL